MSPPEILQISLDAKAQKFVSEFVEIERLVRIRMYIATEK